ncbi:MAG: hypothetical protein FJZ57_05705 [Chlamydiae bacterium]|nr:hypothetical protein [Chlamydiota bacterium]
MDKDSWIIDGNATASFEMRFCKADTVIYFRFNRFICLWRIFKRLICKNPHISDRADGCTEQVRFRLIKYLWAYPDRIKKSIKDLARKYPTVNFFEFNNDAQINAFLKMLKENHKYTYRPYSKLFPYLFQNEKKRIASFLHIPIEIVHIGSTSIPCLGGKGIIDITICTSKENMELVSNVLQNIRYEYRPTFSTPERLYFITYLKDPEEGIRRYHVHLTYTSSKEWNELIEFRNYLRNHPEAAAEYASIKKQAANTVNRDGNLYRKMKEPFLQKINNLIKNAS